MDDIDAMFSDLLGEMDLLTQSLGQETAPPEPLPGTKEEVNFSICFTDLNESLHELEDNDLDALMADLVADLEATEEKLAADKQGLKAPSSHPPDLPSKGPSTHPAQFLPSPTSPAGSTGSNVSTPASSAASPLPPPPPQSAKPTMEEIEAQMKADKIKLALEKLKEAKVKKLVVKVLLNDGSSKTLMVDERQSVREVLDNLFEKTHCDCNVDWSLCETNPELNLERTFEDHENLVEPLLAWTRDSENKVLFQERPGKNEVFKNPQNFYLWKKDKRSLKEIKDKDKELLIQENFCGTSIIVPDLEAVMYLKEDGKKSWKQRLFQLRASGIYYVPKGKTKSSRDLVCFVQFDNLNVYYGNDFKSKYKAPADFCFVLKYNNMRSGDSIQERMMRGGVTRGSYERHQRLRGQRAAGTPEHHVTGRQQHPAGMNEGHLTAATSTPTGETLPPLLLSPNISLSRLPAAMMSKSALLKVILLGDGGVGKSSLMNRYVTNKFDSHLFHTIGVEFLNKELEVDGHHVTLQIWDTAGQERFRSLRTPFYRGSDCCLLTFSLDDGQSFLNLNNWKKEFTYYADVKDPDNFPFVVLGNKLDVSERQVSGEDVRQWCRENGGHPYFETSAKDATNVASAFEEAVRRILALDDRADHLIHTNTVDLQKKSPPDPTCC